MAMAAASSSSKGDSQDRLFVLDVGWFFLVW